MQNPDTEALRRLCEQLTASHTILREENARLKVALLTITQTNSLELIQLAANEALNAKTP